MNDNLPALPQLRTSQELVNPVTDSWAEMLPQVAELARAICTTQFVPEALRNNIAATTAAILYNREIGLPPMTGLNAVHVIKGKVGISAEMMRAKVLEAGHEIWFDETNTSYCIISGRRKGLDRVTTVKYSESDAKTAGLFSNDNYKKNPRRMYQARATSELCALIFADVIRGMSSAEELYDDAEAGERVPVPAEGGTTVQRKTRARKASPAALEAATVVPLPGENKTDEGAAPPADVAPAGGLPAAPSSPEPPLPGEPGFDGPSAAATAESDAEPVTPSGSASTLTDGGAAAPPGIPASSQAEATPTAAPPSPDEDEPPANEPKMVSRSQQGAMFAVFSDLGIDDKAERLHITETIIGRTPMDHKTGQPSSNGLTFDEASTLIDALKKCKTRDHVEALIDMVEQQRAEAGEGGPV